MSNINTVINFIKVEPDYNKEDMVAKIMKTLNVTKSNAQVYLYNANKKLAKGDVPKAVKAAKVKTKEVSVSKLLKDVGIKAKNLDTMKRVSSSQREEARLAKRAELQPVIDQMLDDSQEYVNSLTAPVRKFIAGAE